MTVKLRLMRMGKKKQPTYRIVASDSRSPRDGRFIEVVGTYAPRSEPSVVLVDNAKAVRWLAQGAQPTDTVRKLLAISGAWTEFEAQKGRPHAAAMTAPALKPVAKPAAKPAPADEVKEAAAEIVELAVEIGADLAEERTEAAIEVAEVEGAGAAASAGDGES